MTATLLPALAERLDEVDIDSTQWHATVGDRTLTAETHRQLRAMLSGVLYESWHVGRPPRERPQPLRVRDKTFEEDLRAAVPHDSSIVNAQVDPTLAGPQLVGAQLVGAQLVGAELAVVRLNGIRVLVPAERIVAAGEGGAPQVRLPAVLPAASPGFLMVTGSRGTDLGGGDLLRVYLHLGTPDAAPVVWGAVLTRLEERGVAYRAKVTSGKALFPRRDGMVVYLGPDSWGAVADVRDAAVASGGLDDEVSAYAARLDAGVGCAWEPVDPRPGMGGLSFGQHRSQVISAALVAAAMDGSGDRHAVVAEALLAAGIDPNRPFRNTTSPELSGL
jgi:hypothetical protein